MSEKPSASDVKSKINGATAAFSTSEDVEMADKDIEMKEEPESPKEERDYHEPILSPTCEEGNKTEVVEHQNGQQEKISHLEQKIIGMLKENFSEENLSPTNSSEEVAQWFSDSEDDDSKPILDHIRSNLHRSESVKKDSVRLISNKKSYVDFVNSRSSQEESLSSSLSMSRYPKCRDKLFACFYCSKLFTNMRIHYFRRHFSEAEVQEIQKHSVRSSERSKLLGRLRNMGNFKHNVNVLKTGQGAMIVNRKSKNSDRQNYKNYIPCRHCFGFFYHEDICRHARVCLFNRRDASIHAKWEGTALLYEVTSSLPTQETCVQNILQSIIQDDLFQFLEKDNLVMRYVNFLVYGNVPDDEIKERIRGLGILLILVGEQRSVGSLRDYFVPTFFPLVVTSVIKMAKNIDRKNANSFIRKLGYSIRCCCSINIGLAIKENDKTKQEETEQFLSLINNEWKQSINSLVVKNVGKCENFSPGEDYKMEISSLSPSDDVDAMEISLAKELLKLSDYIIICIKEKMEALEKNICLENWLELTQAVLCRIVVLNKRRGEELTRMLVSSYTCKSSWSVNEQDELHQSLTALERLICKRLDLLRIDGRNGRFAPLLLPPEAKSALDLLMRTREESGIPKQNPYMFSNATNNGHFRSWNIITKYGKQCQLRRLHLLANTNLRKFISAYTQLLLLNRPEMDELVDQLNLGESYRESFDILESPLKGAKLCNLLIDKEVSPRFTPTEGSSFETMEGNGNAEEDYANHMKKEKAMPNESDLMTKQISHRPQNYILNILESEEDVEQAIESEDDDDFLNLQLKRRKVRDIKTEYIAAPSWAAFTSMSSDESLKTEDPTSNITIAVSRNTKNKRCHDKVFACFYCSKLFSNMRIHYFRRHSTEAEVQEIQQYSVRSPERSNLLCRLRNLGNFKHNVKIIRNNEGKLLVNRRPNQLSSHQNFLDYIPCRHCYGFFFKYDLKRHANCCSFNRNEVDKHILTEGSILLYEATSDLEAGNIQNILSGMEKDEVFEALNDDYLIMQLGNFLAENERLSESQIGLKLKYLAKLTILLRERNHTPSASLSDFLKSSCFDSLVSAALKMTNSVNLEKNNSLIYLIDRSIRYCCKIKIGLAIKENNTKRQKETEEFWTLFNNEWKERVGYITMPMKSQEENEEVLNIKDEHSSQEEHSKISEELSQTVVVNDMERSLTKELIKLSKYLIKCVEEKRKALEKNVCQENWLELAQVVLCRILLLNKRRESEEISRLFVVSYKSKCNWFLNPNDDVYKGLTTLEQLLCKRFDVMRFNGRNGKHIPLILPLESKLSLDLLLETRETCGIPKKNPFMFSNATQKGRYKSWNVINKYGRQCKGKRLYLLGNTSLRKFISLCSQLFTLNLDEIETLTHYFVQNSYVAKTFQNLPMSHLKIATLSKLIIEAESNSPDSFAEYCSLRTNFDLRDDHHEESNPPDLIEEGFCIPTLSIECELNPEDEEMFSTESVNRFLEQSLTSAVKMEIPSGGNGENDEIIRQPFKRRKMQTIKRERVAASDMPSSSSNEALLRKQSIKSEVDNLGSKITVSLSRNTKDKRCYDKVFACLYCSKLIPNVRIHYFRTHAKEKEVQEIQKFSIRSPERSSFLSRLRNLGNFKHNVQVIRNNEGMLIVTRRPNQNSDRQNYKDYIPCRHCYGFFHKHELKYHGKTCSFNSSGVSKHTLSEGIILLYEATSDLPSENIFKILASMKDEVNFNVLSNDYLIIRFGNFMADNEKMLGSEISQKMIELTHLLILLREKISDENASLSDFLVLTAFDQIIFVVLQMSSSTACKDPNTLTVELGHSIRSCCNIKIGIAIKENDWKKKAETDDFLTQFNNEWRQRLGSFVLSSPIKSENIEGSTPIAGGAEEDNTREMALTEEVISSMEIPLTEDLMALSEYIGTYINERKEALKKDVSLSNWLELTQASLCRIVLLNKKRGDETTRMLVSSYSCKSNWSYDEEDDLYKGLTALEKLLCKKFHVLRIKGKRGKHMPILIPPETKCSLDLLMETRDTCGVPKDNLFVFSNGTNSGHYRSWNIINKYGKHCKLKMLNLLTNPGLRKFISIRSQLLALSREEMESLLTHLDDSEDVPNKSFNVESSQEFLKICKLLITSESVSLRTLNALSVTQNVEGENVSQSNEMAQQEELDWLGSLEAYDYIPSISEEYDKDYIELQSVEDTKSKLNRFVWPPDLKKSLLKNFATHIADQKCPGKQECEEWLNKVNVTNIPWKKVKDCVKNSYYVRK